MGNKKMIVLIFILFPLYFLFAQNSMEQLAYLEGEQVSSGFGWIMASLDFNGDGYDDLVISSPNFRDAENNVIGKLYCYLGGETFNTEADFTITGDSNSQIKHLVANLGDLNSDGYEDLVIRRKTSDSLSVCILDGNAELDSIPDHEFRISNDEYNLIDIRALGDINNDGYDDIGIVKGKEFSPIEYYPFEFYFCFGNQNILTLEYFYEAGDGMGPSGFSGIGDVNNDGYNDFCIGYSYLIEDDRHYTNTLYYGGEDFEPEPDLILWDYEYTNMTLGLPTGDLNSDGYDDFAGHLTTTIKLWYGQDIITTQYDLLLHYGSGGGGGDYAFDHGDVNNDGYSDLGVGSPHGGLNGMAFLYLGGENPNNTYDFEFEEPPGVDHNYGTSLTIGRFDVDEYEDVAIGAPLTGSGNSHGYVYVFAGNGDLQDLVGIENHEVPAADDIVFHAYPNPFNPTVTFEIKAEDYDNLQIEIFNIKGQKVETISNHQIARSSNHQITWNAENQASGIYYCKLVNVETGQKLSVQKITLLK